MELGITLGLLTQLFIAIGFVVFLKAVQYHYIPKISLTLIVDAIIATVILIWYADVVSNIPLSDIIKIGIGGVLALLVGNIVFFWGIHTTNATTVGMAGLSFPIFVIIIELIMGHYTPTDKDLLGFILLAVGYVILTMRKTKFKKD